MSRPPEKPVEYLDQTLDLCRSVNSGWIHLNQLIRGYPRAQADRGRLESEFLSTKSTIARTVPVLKSRLQGSASFEDVALNFLGGVASLETLFNQSEVAVKKALTEWHRVYIQIEECIGNLEEKRRNYDEGKAVFLGPYRIRPERKLPVRQVLIVGGCVGAVLAAFTVHIVLRDFLGVWAPGEGEGIAVVEGMSDEDQVDLLQYTLMRAFQERDVDTLMTAVADDFRGPGELNKTALRALIQTISKTYGLDSISLDTARAMTTFQEQRASYAPVRIMTPAGDATLVFIAEKRRGQWLITSIQQN